MKSFLSTCIFLLLLTVTLAQPPEKMSYQAVIRDAGGALLVNQTVGMQISVLFGSPTGSAVFVETHTPTTNANGLVSIEIGGGSTVSGVFASINWASGDYYLKTETDPAGGTTYTLSGTTQLLSVPYALHAKTANSATRATTAATATTATNALSTNMQPYQAINYIIATDGVFPSRGPGGALGTNNVILGEIKMFAGNFAPRGYELCNGQILPIASYTALFSLLGTTYGGDGRTTFALPDLRGRAPIHFGSGPGLTTRRIGDKSGSESN